MKTKTITLYSFDELSKEAQERAHKDWIEGNDYTFLSDVMNEWLHELLVENKIKDLYGKYDKVNQKDNRDKKAHVSYSLSNCQGDGAMFEGDFEWKTHKVSIKHSGRYYHSNSKVIEIWDDAGEFVPDGDEEDYKQFESIYQSICKELEHRGYDLIEHEDSLENFQEMCELNEYTFLSTGKMEN